MTPEQRERARQIAEEGRIARESFVRIVERIEERRRARAPGGPLRRLLRRFV